MVDVAPSRQRRRVRLVLVEDLDRPDRQLRGAQEVGSVGEVVGAEHHVDERRAFAHAVAILLGQAAADRDLQVGPRGLERLQVAEVGVELVVGVLPDAARVEHDDVGFGEVVGRLHAVGREHSRDAFRVVLVHLAPVGAYVETPRH